jgi:hypothetical protein
MNCARIQELLLEYRERRTDSDVEASVKEHLSFCPDCRRVADGLQRTLELLARDEVPDFPVTSERFLQDVRRRIRQAPRERRIRLPRLVPVLAAAAALLIAVGLFWRAHRRPAAPDTELLESFAVASEEMDSDIFSSDSIGVTVLTEQDLKSLDTLERELAEDSDVDDLFDDLSTEEETRLIQALQRVYGQAGNSPRRKVS